MKDDAGKLSVFVQGIFDDLRTIDIRFLQEAAKLGGVHVLLFADHQAQQSSGREVKFPVEERAYYLNNIRYVDRVTIIEDGSVDALPQDLIIAGSTWAVRESDANVQKSVFCESNNLIYAIIPDADLTGFPTETIPDDKDQKKVMVSGCFDWVHTGHVRFFEEVSAYGNLYVVVGHDANLLLLKGEGHPLFSQEERRYWVQAIRFVKKALISTGDGWLDAKPEIEKLKPDIFIVNQDGDKPEKQQLFKELGIEYMVLERKPKPGLQARMSTDLRGF